MKQPKRSGLAWSHGRDAALLRAVSSRSSTTPTNLLTPEHCVFKKMLKSILLKWELVVEAERDGNRRFARVGL